MVSGDMNRVDASANIKQIREKILVISTRAKEGHIPSALSILDLLWCLYDSILKISPFDIGRDFFIMSKGHASIGLYSVLAHKGFIEDGALESFAKFNSILGGHPDRNKVPFVEASTGSLGHGMPIAVGVALSKKTNNSGGGVYVLVGDGECNEGSVWESALLASEHQLNNLCCIVDHNHTTDRALSIDSIVDKFTAFGWEVVEIDGHDHCQILNTLGHFTARDNAKPFCIVANTIKGKGIRSMENNPEWHHKTPSAQELAIFLEEIHAND
jgi:transketolase